MKNLYSFLMVTICSMGIILGQAESEPNDVPLQADEIFMNSGMTGSLSGSDVHDWYVLDIPQSGILKLTFQKTGSGNGTLYLRDGEITGEPEITNMYLSFYESPTEGWTLSYPLLAGKYYIQVNKNSDVIQYTLTATLTVPGYNEDMEPNGTLGQALVMPANGIISGNLHYYGAGEGFDLEDWYRVVIPEAGILQLTIRKKGAGNTWMYFKDGEKAENPEIANYYFGYWESPTEGWSWSYPVLAGTYYFQITGGGNVVDYQIEARLAPPAYPEDTEPNAEVSTALAMPYNGTISGNLHYYGAGEGFDAEDWYKMVVPNAGILQFTIRKKGTGNTWMYFKDGEKAGNPEIANYYFGYWESPTEGWSWSYPVLAGTYYFQITGGGEVVDYQIESRLTPPAFPEDTEPNNDAISASNMPHDNTVSGNLRYYGAGEGYDPEDWYKMEVPEGGILSLTIHKKGPGNTWLYFLDGEKAGNPEITNFYFGYWESPAEGWSWSYPVLAGTYYFRLANGGNILDYQLISKLTPPEFGEDKEPNDTLTIAQIVPLDDSVGGTLGYYNPGIGIDNWDWFAVTTSEEGMLSFTITKKGGNNGNLRLRNTTGEIASHYLTFGDLVTRFSKIVPAGTYYLGFEKFSGDLQYKITTSFLPVPEAGFTFLVTENIVSFENTSDAEEASFLWSFDDNTTSNTVNAYHEYKVPKNYNVCLIATNPAGKDTLCKTVIIPGVERIQPAEGGNTGEVTIEVFGGGLDTFFKGKIMSGTSLIAASIQTNIAGPSSISLSFDLRGKVIGNYQLYIEKSGGPSYNIPGGFKIIKGVASDPWVNLVGRNRFLFNTWTTYTVNYGNKGNIDAVMVPFYIVISRSPGLEVDFKEVGLYSIDSAGVEKVDDNIYVDADTLFGEPKKVRAYAFIMPLIPANSSNAFNIKIKSGESVTVDCWAEKPWFQSPPNHKKIVCTADILGNGPIPQVSAIQCFEKELEKRLIDGAAEMIKIKTLCTFEFPLDDEGRKKCEQTKAIIHVIKTIGSISKACKVKPEERDTLSKWLVRAIIANALKLDAPLNRDHFSNEKDITRGSSDECSAEFEPQNPGSMSATAVSSLDPNEKAGPAGYGPDNYVSENTGFPYTIYFENKATATAPAHQIAIADSLDMAVFDLASFSFGNIYLGDSIIHVSPGLHSFSFDKKLSGLNVIARVSGELDTLTGTIKWLFRSLDPGSFEDVEDPDIGILPPNILSPAGEGNVTCFVKLKNKPVHGQQIKNKANIIFDANPAIITNEHVVTFDLQAPSSAVDSVVSILGTEQIRVAWSGSDGDSGLKSYYIYSINSHKDTVLWLGGTTETSGVFLGQAGGTYSFYSIAVDYAGNVEEPPAQPDGSVTISDTDDEGKTGRELYLYPNPTDGQLTIVNSGLQGGCLTLMQSDGQLVTRFYLKAQSSQHVDVSGVPEGLLQWFWAIDCSTNLLSGRVVIIR